MGQVNAAPRGRIQPHYGRPPAQGSRGGLWAALRVPEPESKAACPFPTPSPPRAVTGRTGVRAGLRSLEEAHRGQHFAGHERPVQILSGAGGSAGVHRNVTVPSSTCGPLCCLSALKSPPSEHV